MCEKFCGILANIAAQIASEALGIQAHRLSPRFLHDTEKQENSWNLGLLTQV